jgi:hypothetical protein
MIVLCSYHKAEPYQIQVLSGSMFGLTSKVLRLVLLSGSIYPTMVDPLWLISHNYLNICKPKFRTFDQ